MIFIGPTLAIWKTFLNLTPSSPVRRSSARGNPRHRRTTEGFVSAHFYSIYLAIIYEFSYNVADKSPKSQNDEMSAD